MSYKLNTANARAMSIASQINEKGAYLGRFTRAEEVKSQKGTKGVEFDFKSDDGQTAQYLTVWVENFKGEELHGRKVIDAIMTCLEVREMTATRTRIKKFNNDTRQEEMADALVFPELGNKPIGVLLVREEYEANDGSVKWKNLLLAAFDHATRKSPKEKLDRLPAEAVEKWTATLRDRPIKARNGMRPATPPAGAPAAHATGTGFDNMDDDIPFIVNLLDCEIAPPKVRRLRRSEF